MHHLLQPNPVTSYTHHRTTFSDPASGKLIGTCPEFSAADTEKAIQAAREAFPKFRIPQNGAPSDVAAQLLRDELDLDGRPSLNLARYDNHARIVFRTDTDMNKLCRDVYGTRGKRLDG